MAEPDRGRIELGPVATQLPARGLRDAPVARTRPRLPRPPAELVGRDAELETVARAIRDPGLVVLQGEGGVGKSALAASVCRRLARDEGIGGSIAWVDFDQYPEQRDSHRVLLQMLRHVSESLMPQTVESDERLVDAVLEHLERVPSIVVLDNVERFHLSPPLREWVEEASASARVLITTRGLPGMLRGRYLTLPELSEESSRALFASLWRSDVAESAHDDAADRIVRDICKEVGHLPLALELVASRRLPLDVLLKTVRDELADISSETRTGPARQRSMSACFKVSYDQLGEQAQSLFLHTSVLPGGVSTALLNAITGGGRWAESAEQLVDAALWRLQIDRYVTHPLVRRFALQELGEDRPAAERKVSGDLAEWLGEQGQLTEPSVPHGQRLEALNAIEAEWRNIVFAVDAAARSNDAGVLTTAATALRDFCWQRSHWEDCEPMYRQVLETVRTADEPVVLAQTLECLGLLHQRIGAWSVATGFFDDCLATLGTLATNDAKLIRCRAKYGLGLACAVMGQPERGRPHLLEAITLASEIQSPTAEAIAHSNLGVLHISERQWDRAYASLKRSLTIRNALGDASGEGDIHLRLATVSHIRGDFADACAVSGRAVDLFREIDNRLDEMIALVRKAEALRELGSWQEALAASEKALAEFREQGHHGYYEASALNQIALTRLDQGKWELALDSCESSIAVSVKAGDVVGEAFGRYVKARALTELGSSSEARSEFDTSEALFSEHHDTIMIGRVRVARSRLLCVQEPDVAVELAQRALETLEACGDVIGVALAHSAIGDAHARRDAREAIRAYTAAWTTFQEKRIAFRGLRCKLAIAAAYLALDDLHAARDALAEVSRALPATEDELSRARYEELLDRVQGRADEGPDEGARTTRRFQRAPARSADTPTAHLLGRRESSVLEYKRHALVGHDERPSDKAKEKIVKTVTGFLNSRDGGTLLIGVDDGTARPVGLDADYAASGRGDRDGFEQELVAALCGAIGDATMAQVSIRFEVIEERDVCRLDIGPAFEPIHLRDGSLFVRIGNATKPLSGAQATKYVRTRWPNVVR